MSGGGSGRPNGPRRPGAPGAYNGPGKGRPFTARPSGPRREGDDADFAPRGSRFTREQEMEADALARGEQSERPRRDDAPRDDRRDNQRDYQRDDRPRGDRPPGNRPPFRQRPPGPGKDEMIFGTRPVQEALLAGRALERVYVQRGLKSPLGNDVLEAARNLHVPIQEVPLEKLNSITRKNHQGVVALLPVIEYQPLAEVVQAAFEAGRTPLVVVLDRVTDVRNFGSIARAAECLGADALLVPTKGAAQINGDAVKTSAGALNRLPVCREPNLHSALRFLHDSGMRVVACTEKAQTTLGVGPPPDLTGPIALVLGSEEDGISLELLRLAEVEVKIPILGQIGSLNVAVAAGIALYEVQRQRSGASE